MSAIMSAFIPGLLVGMFSLVLLRLVVMWIKDLNAAAFDAALPTNTGMDDRFLRVIITIAIVIMLFYLSIVVGQL